MEEIKTAMPEQIGADYDPLTDARARMGAQLVAIPGVGDGKPWYAKLRRVSLLGLAMTGKIPNPLLSAVTELYKTGVVHTDDLKLSAEVMHLVATEALAQPTMQELEEAGITLSDMQLTAIYLYAQRGAEALRPFRRESEVLHAGADGAAVQRAAQQLAEHRG